MTSLSLLVAACGASTSNGATTAPTSTPTPTHIPTDTPVPSPTTTVTATPTPTPASAKTCSFVWATSYVDIDGTYDFYEVDVAGASWNNTTAALDGLNATSYFIVGWNPTDNSIYSAGMAISGPIVLNVAGQAIGDAANFSDAGSKSYYDAYDYFTGASTSLGGVIAAGGAGFFTGVLSDPDPNAAATAGGGSVDATDTSGFAETFGGATQYDLDYAVCTP